MMIKGKITRGLPCLFLLLSPVLSHTQEASQVALVNRGKMYVAASGAANLYVLGSMRMAEGVCPVNIVQEGVMKLSGNFYHDAAGHVFKTDAAGYGTGNGTVCFFGNDLDRKQISSAGIPNFNRPVNYVAFPKVRIEMDRNLVLPSRMSADMDRLEIAASKTGKLYLESATAADGKIYDASLRFPKRTAGEADNITTQSANAPSAGIIVERDIVPYRSNATAQGVIFPFATPFSGTQRSGYFAGNWVRCPASDEAHHTEYPYGDKLDSNRLPDRIIAADQYVIDPNEMLQAGQAYLVRPLGTDDFDRLPADFPDFGLRITGAGNPDASEYKKTRFVFDGSVYHLAPAGEQLNLQPIFNATLTGNPEKTVNVLIGNSYTSAIDLKKLSNYMLDHPTLYFNRNIYVYSPHLATPYTPYDSYQHYPGQQTAASLLPESTVPAMGVFMLRLAKRNSSGNVTIDRTFLSHGNNANNLKSGNEYDNELLFKLTNETYPNIYDLAAIGIRSKSKEVFESLDMQKMTGETTEVPMVYTLSSDDVKLASNSVPQTAQYVNLCVESHLTEAARCTLEVSRLESMQTEYLVLEDRLQRRFIDLHSEDSYGFVLDPAGSAGSLQSRFAVHFVRPLAMDLPDTEAAPLQLYYNKNAHSIEIIGLTEKDSESRIIVSDAQGRRLLYQSVEPSIAVDFLPKGVYVAKVSGYRTAVLKFIK
jgi:hypothetical protein